MDPRTNPQMLDCGWDTGLLQAPCLQIFNSLTGKFLGKSKETRGPGGNPHVQEGEHAQKIHTDRNTRSEPNLEQ